MENHLSHETQYVRHFSWTDLDNHYVSAKFAHRHETETIRTAAQDNFPIELIIIIIIDEFHRDASLEQNFKAAKSCIQNCSTAKAFCAV